MFIVKQVVNEEGMDDNNCYEGGFTYLKKSILKKMHKTEEELNTTQSLKVAKLGNKIRLASEKTSEESRASK